VFEEGGGGCCGGGGGGVDEEGVEGSGDGFWGWEAGFCEGEGGEEGEEEEPEVEDVHFGGLRLVSLRRR